MKKQLFTTMASLLIICSVHCQNAIPNPGFENWVAGTGYSDPTSWGTINSSVATFCGCAGTCRKTTVANEVHSGAAAVKLITISVFGQVAPGIVATGTINTNTQKVDGGVAFTLRPDSLVGWYQYTPTGSDTGMIEARLSKWNTNTNVRDLVGVAQLIKTTTVSSYTRFSSLFNYSLGVTPDTMVITMLASSAVTPVVNSFLIVDDLDLIYNSTGINAVKNDGAISVYPNPATDAITFSLKGTQNFIVKILDAAGRVLITKENNSADCRINTTDLSNGIYFYELNTSGKLSRGKFVISK